MKTLIKNLINKIVKSEESPFPKGHKDGYWVFENGNKFSAWKYDYEKAKELNETLVNCRNCVNCKNCYWCTNCVDCVNCDVCDDCEVCKSCVRCKGEKYLTKYYKKRDDETI